jgi:hypothetical protein
VEILTSVFDRFRDADNRGAVQVLLAVLLALVAWATGLLNWLVWLFTPAAREKPMPPTLRQTEYSVTVIGGGWHIVFLDNVLAPLAGCGGS